jgi:hypothetical protein
MSLDGEGWCACCCSGVVEGVGFAAGLEFRKVSQAERREVVGGKGGVTLDVG